MSRRRRRSNFVYLFADIALVMSLLALVAIFALWTAGHAPGGVEWHLGSEESNSRLMLCSRGERLIIGVYMPVRTGFWYRSRGGQGTINLLLDDDQTYLAGDLLSFGIGAPHWALALALVIVPTWWWMLRRNRIESQRRMELGLCKNCGYDMRASTGRCPECGEPIPPLALRRTMEPDPAPAPAPLLREAAACENASS